MPRSCRPACSYTRESSSSARKPGAEVARLTDRAAAQCLPPACRRQQGDVGERVAERRHLPVDHGRGSVLGRRRGRCRGGSPRARCRSVSVVRTEPQVARGAGAPRAGRGCRRRRAVSPSAATVARGTLAAGRSPRVPPRRVDGVQFGAGCRPAPRRRPGCAPVRAPARSVGPSGTACPRRGPSRRRVRRGRRRPRTAPYGGRHRRGGVRGRGCRVCSRPHVVRGGQYMAQWWAGGRPGWVPSSTL